MCVTDESKDGRELRAAVAVAKSAARNAVKEAVFVADDETTKATRAAYLSLSKALDALDKKELD